MIEVVLIDWGNPQEAEQAWLVLDSYARDPMGGGEALDPGNRGRLAKEMAARPWSCSFLAKEGEHGVGLAICFEQFSTFSCAPILNLHDIAILPRHRGKGIFSLLLEAIEKEAKARGCIKMTLEVLQGNSRARDVYEHCGFRPYQLRPSEGNAEFWQKMLP